MKQVLRQPRPLLFAFAVVFGCLAPAVFFVLRVYPAHAAREDIQFRAQKLIASFPEYADHAPLIDEVLVIAHEHALDQSFRTSRVKVIFDEPKYVGTLYSEMVRLLGERGETDLSAAMQDEWKKSKALPPTQ